MTNATIATLQTLNGRINDTKREIKDLLAAPVVASIYDENEGLEDVDFVLETRDIYPVFTDVVRRLAKDCRKRRRIIDANK